MATLTDKAQTLLDDLHPVMAEDPAVQQVAQAVANELDLLETTMAAVREKMFPQNADDTYLTLSMLEAQLGLPVAPAGQSISTRRNLVLGNIQKRGVGTGAQWEDAITTALGNTPWQYVEGPGSYQVTIYISYGSGSFTAAQIQQLARDATPAHIDVVAAFTQGFLVGISQVGVEPL